MILVFFNIIIAVFSLGNAAQFVGTLANGKGAAYEVLSIIDRKPLINSDETDSGKIRLTNLEGNIEFSNVSFKYPSREQVQVLNEISFKIKAGSTVALVGSSGCGKSTCIQLLQRFYDSINGQVLIDNVDIKELELNWLRSQLGVVNQEPILFGN